MKRESSKYNLAVRTFALFLGLGTSLMSILMVVVAISDFGSAWWFLVVVIPLQVFGYLMLHVSCTGIDPIWFYNLIDVPEENDESVIHK